MNTELDELKKDLKIAESILDYYISPETREDAEFDIACSLVERSYQETGVNNYHVSHDEVNKILKNKIAEYQEEIKNIKQEIEKHTEKQEVKTMDFKEMKDMIIEMQDKNYDEFVKALIAVEKGIDDEKVLDSLYNRYMDEDSMSLLDENFDYIIDEMRDEGIVVDSIEKEKSQNELVNLVGNLTGDVKVEHISSVKGNEFDVANFSICTKGENGEKTYNHISAYGDKVNDVKDYKRGDFVKVFGQMRHSVGSDGREYTDLKLFSAKMLKAKSQMKNQEQKKESTLGKLKQLKEKVDQEKNKTQDKAEKKNDREM